MERLRTPSDFGIYRKSVSQIGILLCRESFSLFLSQPNNPVLFFFLLQQQESRKQLQLQKCLQLHSQSVSHKFSSSPFTLDISLPSHCCCAPPSDQVSTSLRYTMNLFRRNNGASLKREDDQSNNNSSRGELTGMTFHRCSLKINSEISTSLLSITEDAECEHAMEKVNRDAVSDSAPQAPQKRESIISCVPSGFDIHEIEEEDTSKDLDHSENGIPYSGRDYLFRESDTSKRSHDQPPKMAVRMESETSAISLSTTSTSE